MRSIPHRVVCLLGLDDGSFPRHVERDGDDLTARRSARSATVTSRSEDRQLLLDALLAATRAPGHHLLGPRRAHQPAAARRPCRSASCSTWWTTPCAPAKGRATRRHRGRRTRCSRSTPGTSRRARWCRDGPGASTRCTWPAPRRRGLLGRHRRRSSARRSWLSEPDRSGLDQLERFVRHPVRAFLRERLHVSLRNKTRDFEDAIPIELDGLGDLADRRAHPAGSPGRGRASRTASRRSGPGVHCRPASWPTRCSTAWSGPLEDLVQAGALLVAARPRSDVHVALTGQLDLVGTVAGVRGRRRPHRHLLEAQPGHRLVAWVRLLALSATWPERAFETRSIGRSAQRSCTISRGDARAAGDRRGEPACAGRGAPRGPGRPVRPGDARAAARSTAGPRRPGPPPCGRPGRRRKARDPPSGPGRRATTSTRRTRRPSTSLVLGRARRPSRRCSSVPERPRGDEAAGTPRSNSRFGLLARRLWDGLLEHEQVADR